MRVPIPTMNAVRGDIYTVNGVEEWSPPHLQPLIIANRGFIIFIAFSL